MEIHVHSTRVILEVRRQERKTTQTNKTHNTDQTNKHTDKIRVHTRAYELINQHVHVTVGFELGGGVLPIGRLVWFVVDKYYCSETTTTQACLGYVSLGHCRAMKHTQR